MIGYGRSDLRPILRLKGFKRGRKEISIFHHHVVPLVRDEIANDDIDILPKNFTIREHVLDRVSDAAQAFTPLGCSRARSPTFAAATGSRSLSLAKVKSPHLIP